MMYLSIRECLSCSMERTATGHAGSEVDIPLKMSLLLRNGKLAIPKYNKRDFKKKHKNRLQYD